MIHDEQFLKFLLEQGSEGDQAEQIDDFATTVAKRYADHMVKRAAVDPVEVTINGTKLSVKDVIILRAAIGAFDLQLASEGLGDDAHGLYMVEVYQAGLSNLIKLLRGTK